MPPKLMGAEQWIERLAWPLVAPRARSLILDALLQARGDRAVAAALLGVSPRALYRLLTRLELHDDAHRQDLEMGRRGWSPGRPRP